jgi:hypothetical protein
MAVYVALKDFLNPETMKLVRVHDVINFPKHRGDDYEASGLLREIKEDKPIKINRKPAPSENKAIDERKENKGNSRGSKRTGA